MQFIVEPQKQIPVCYEADVCVVGGSCTGVFAAVRAARLGSRVVLVEKQNSLGGVATNGLVNIWHSLYDTEIKNQIIAGLTYETVERLQPQNAIHFIKEDINSYSFNPSELKIELDTLVAENNIQCFLHTFYCGIQHDEKEVTSILIENKDGRSAIKAKFFIDATGDGDLARDLNIESYRYQNIQPPSACFLMQGSTSGLNLGELIREHGQEVGLENDWGWSNSVPGIQNMSMRADNHVFHVLCNRADDLTFSEIEGRRQMRSLLTLLKRYGHPEENYALVSTCTHIGIRDTAHYKTKFCATEQSLLLGERYPNAILNGTYRVDIHHSQDMGITFKYLNGKTHTIYGKEESSTWKNWREEQGLTGEPATFYQVPFEILVGDYYTNFIAAGRMLNADSGAFGALRVMVNLNQLGEAAGVAAYLSLHQNCPVGNLNGMDVRHILQDGGSIII